MEGKRLSDDSVLKTDPRYRKLEHLIQVEFILFTEAHGQIQIKFQIQRQRQI